MLPFFKKLAIKAYNLARTGYPVPPHISNSMNLLRVHCTSFRNMAVLTLINV